MTSDRTRASYDVVAARYAQEFGTELDGKPLDRALLACLVDLAGREPAPIADVGCGAGHISGHLAGLGATVLGVDLSPGMIAQARIRHPALHFTVGSLLELPAEDGAWAGAACLYSIIHLTDPQRPVAYAELARAVRPGGWLLVAFHVSDDQHGPGEIVHRDEWWGQPIDLDFHFLDPDAVAAGLTAAGWRIWMRTLREPYPEVEHQSRRAYLLAQRAGIVNRSGAARQG